VAAAQVDVFATIEIPKAAAVRPVEEHGRPMARLSRVEAETPPAR
jgi:hypothetical protein